MFLRNLILKDFWLKLSSLALAVLIWLTVTIAIRNEMALSNGLASAPPRTFSLRIAPVSGTADVRGVRVNPEFAEVTVRGELGSFENLQAKDIHVLADLTGGDPTRSARVRLEVTAPPGVEIVRVIPADVEILPPPKSR
ncbi:MAG: hypothetical protein RLZZ221_1951 [Verrucomicrobiota bacterium]